MDQARIAIFGDFYGGPNAKHNKLYKSPYLDTRTAELDNFKTK